MNFNAREIFDIGVQIEVNGKAFYEAAAKKTAETALREFFLELAAWENTHIKLFGELRDALPKGAGSLPVFDPNDEAALYLQATADSHVFVRNKDMVALVAGCKGPLDILDVAMTFEKDSVVYYTTMKKVVAKNLGQDKVDRLIDEEIKHISLLSQRRAKLASR
ncbi:MAG: ferritin family protein [Spirochaetes bacterium]|nr:ferritin family protein [Spirochaetota bacterium]